MKMFCSHKDIDMIIEVLKVAMKNTEGMHAGQMITPSINRVIFQLEELKKEDMKELLK